MGQGTGGGLFDSQDGPSVQRAYRAWAPVYDVVCGAILDQARRAAAEAARLEGGRILEIGIGTGLSMKYYRGPGIELTGIDFSDSMLARARRRLASGDYPHVRDLEVMDAHTLAFDDGAFDSVVAQFTIPLVADPEQVLSECARVVRPGGQIVLVSHFYSERGMAAHVERWVGEHLRGLGLRPEFPVARLLAWAERDGRTELVERRRIAPFGHTLVRFRRTAGDDAEYRSGPRGGDRAEEAVQLR